jgi:threonylcarbamoyladenosine tRNA methylthiotransferase MtaB
MRVAFYTLGCKVNQTETEALTGIFRNDGYEVVPFEEQADVYVINTCTVTNMGDRKSRQVIRRAAKLNPEGIVVVMGCYAQTSPEEVLKIPGVDLVVGTQQRGRILDLVEGLMEDRQTLNVVQDLWQGAVFEELPTIESESRVRATLKIQEGCNQFCTYCIIPYARGPVRSRDPEKALEEARKLTEAGYVELVLTGIHTGAYGTDLGIDLNYLVSRLVDLPGLKRLRLSSIEVTELTPDLVETLVTNPKICPHLHIPLQSGSDHILSRMNRPYTTREFAEVVNTLRLKLPGLAITTDLIVGFPGEDAEDHKASLEFARNMGFAGIHVFKYSPRTGTPAAGYSDQVTPVTKEERSKEFLRLAEASWQKYAQNFLGDTLEVLVEQTVGENLWEGHTANYLRVRFASKEEELRGRIMGVKLHRLSKNYILGEDI